MKQNNGINNMLISNDIKYVGVNDHQIDLFEGQYSVPNGMSYNSYIILDEKIAVMDTVDIHFTKNWLDNIESALNGRKPDYLVVQHMEPDHSANIQNFLKKYPGTTLVGNTKTFKMIDQFFPSGLDAKRHVVNDRDTISLGSHSLTFIFAQMVHWPEVMVTYDSESKALFSADGFGKFGALDIEEEWTCEARRYYVGIVGKYGSQVQKLLKDLTPFDIRMICPLHGPVLSENIDYYIDKYDTWSSYSPEESGVLIAYASIYGNTKKAAELLCEELKSEGCANTVIMDLAREDMAECVENAFRYNCLILASVTYNGGLFPCMKNFIQQLTERNYQNRAVGFIENGTWAPAAKRNMFSMLEKSKNISFLKESVTVRSAMDKDAESAIKRMAEEIIKKSSKEDKNGQIFM